MPFQILDYLSKNSIDLFGILVTLFLGLIGLILANNYRRQVKQKAADGRMKSYAELWTLMEPARPVQEKEEKYYRPKDRRIFTELKRVQMHVLFTKWYYQNGNGMYLGDGTRRMYLEAKHNLVCPDEKIKPKDLYDKNLEGKAGDERQKCRSHLSISQLSLLRARMRADLEVYGGLYYGELDEDDKAFLKHCGQKLWERPWQTLP